METVFIMWLGVLHYGWSSMLDAKNWKRGPPESVEKQSTQEGSWPRDNLAKQGHDCNYESGSRGAISGLIVEIFLSADSHLVSGITLWVVIWLVAKEVKDADRCWATSRFSRRFLCRDQWSEECLGTEQVIDITDAPHLESRIVPSWFVDIHRFWEKGVAVPSVLRVRIIL